MTVKKILVILYILSLFTLTGCESTKTLNYNPEIIVYGPVLKISLIQTAHEIYSTNIENSSEDLSIESIYSSNSTSKSFTSSKYFSSYSIISIFTLPILIIA